jgi:hypothetical protein
MTEQKISEKMSSFSRPMISTMFHIDFEWLMENDQNWHISLSGYLCEKHRMFFDTTKGHQMIDSINPKTGEVIQTDQLMDILMNHCAKQIISYRLMEPLPILSFVFSYRMGINRLMQKKSVKS